MALQKWVPLPSWWINEKRLRELRWGADGKGSDNSAALIALAVITHHANDGMAKLTYSQLCKATGLSRSKLSNGLDVLEKMGIVDRAPHGRSTYALKNFDIERSGVHEKFRWAMLPAQRLYSAGRAFAFSEFKLRSETELNALKLYFLFAARRGRDTNMANISYDKIEEYTAIERHHIKAAISLLAALSLVYVEHVRSENNDYGIANAYRLAGLDSYRHLGTRGRAMDLSGGDGGDENRNYG
jgi:DNA-binding transcriptional ArsR family regulator